MSSRTPGKTVNLALQGGGSHGAFTWGVLDRLLEDDRLSYEGMCATSAGAMNATVMAYGMTTGGRDGAKRALAEFWRHISEAAAWSSLRQAPFSRMMRTDLWFDMMTRLLSPYQFNPLNYNPLRAVLEKSVDFERLRRESAVKLFLCATNVRTGKVRIFENAELTAAAVLASGCLPFLFQAVEIDGEAYWDGGYMGNPAIFPLIYNCVSTDVIVVHINPIVRNEIPRTASAILDRLNEISFNSSLMREMRAIAFVNKLIGNGNVRGDEMKSVLVHAIEAEGFMQTLDVESKLDVSWDFLTALRDKGRACAGEWLAANFDSLGVRSTIDVTNKYL